MSCCKCCRPNVLRELKVKNLCRIRRKILAMAEGYKMPDLINYYCANECPIADDNVFITKNQESNEFTP